MLARIPRILALTTLTASVASNTGCKACDRPDEVLITAGGTMDPIPPVTSNTAPTGEPTPTGGQELCPGYNDVCIFDDPGQTRTVFQCDGTARIRLNADPFGTEYDDISA